MDLSTLRDIPKMSIGKSTSAAQVTPSSPEVEEVRVEVAPRTVPSPTPKRPVEKLALHQEDPTRIHKRAKLVVGKHMSRHDEGSSQMPSKDKGAVAPSEEATPPVRRRSKLMKELCRTTIRKNDEGYYVVHMTTCLLKTSTLTCKPDEKI
ncbi:hypothetical protein B296_00014810 [Ensete ventricosum]|uniref:Uncharacterized protein n=1 Tax=Ensete ventricosum TaxID=4639 RepID=A0A427B350_ENSVE|nr:hypothetical protein B296_00014810 [Ensete ventricosum]